MAATANIRFFRGEDIELDVTMDPNPVGGVVGWAITFTLRKRLNQLPIIVTKTIGDGVTITNGPAGQFSVLLASSDTAELELDSTDDDGNTVGVYFFDIQRTDPGSRRVITFGTVTLEQAVRNIPT